MTTNMFNDWDKKYTQWTNFIGPESWSSKLYPGRETTQALDAFRKYVQLMRQKLNNLWTCDRERATKLYSIWPKNKRNTYTSWKEYRNPHGWYHNPNITNPIVNLESSRKNNSIRRTHRKNGRLFIPSLPTGRPHITWTDICRASTWLWITLFPQRAFSISPSHNLPTI